MTQRTQHGFSQSEGMIRSLSAACPALMAGRGGFGLVKRAKGSKLHTLDGTVFHDFWLDDGRLLFGHAPGFLGQQQKNHISTGILAGYPQPVHVKLLARLSRILPGYSLAFLTPADIARLEAVPQQKDLSETAFMYSPALLAGDERPARILVRGVLGMDIVAWLPGSGCTPCAPFWPDSVTTARALGLLERLTGPHAPWPVCVALSERLVRRAGPYIVERRGHSVRIDLDGYILRALLDEGWYLSETGWIHFCTEHDPATVDRLARAIVTYKEKTTK